ncbi:MAG TPA: hypothetical protein VN289_18775 [Paraburkholderia sp.]|jgi:hypothetical protein|nr:hypothetical protein [Paraburkholderia sp.]
MGDFAFESAFGLVDRPSMFYRFERRAPMSYRHVLRTIPKPLRRQWLVQRHRCAEPRVAISRLYRLR